MGGGRGGGRNRATRGADLRYNLRITLEEALTVCKKRSMFQHLSLVTNVMAVVPKVVQNPQPAQHVQGWVKFAQPKGSLRLNVPAQHVRVPVRSLKTHAILPRSGPQRERSRAECEHPCGCRNGTRIRLSGEGEAGLRGGSTGDLYIFIEVDEHEIFQRDSINLYCRVPVSMVTAALGGDIEVPSIDGGRSRVKVPMGSQSGRQMRLRGKGMPAVRSSQTGDMFIELSVETPVNLTSKQKELLREFEELSEENSPESSNFFSSVKSFWDSMKG